MELVRDSWTDERLDDFRSEMSEFRREVKEEFANVGDEMRGEFRAVRREMRDEFATVRKEMKDEFAVVRQDMKALNQRFDSLHRIMIQFCGLMVAALIGLIATQA
jgi:ElaB/YqjD/DUF883 family membrane-anchored ribosome-binding protein